MKGTDDPVINTSIHDLMEVIPIQSLQSRVNLDPGDDNLDNLMGLHILERVVGDHIFRDILAFQPDASSDSAHQALAFFNGGVTSSVAWLKRLDSGALALATNLYNLVRTLRKEA
jgi:hypothetical protein